MKELSNKSQELRSKSLSIDADAWKKVREVTARKQLSYKNQNEVLGMMLERFARKEIQIESSYPIVERKTSRVTLKEEQWVIYQQLREGTRSIVVNGLLRTWLKENE